ncbi:MAG: response regulator [Planctomycetes bacterium]|nr:response regulator [Planctomycetota bacterium]
MTQPHILVVDDDPGIRFALALKLRSVGYEVSEATDGIEALESVAKRCPDLVVLDVGMPRLDGYSVAQRLHADAATRAVPIVILTAQNLQVPADVAAKLGRHRFLTKPFSPREVQRTIGELLQREA